MRLNKKGTEPARRFSNAAAFGRRGRRRRENGRRDDDADDDEARRRRRRGGGGGGAGDRPAVGFVSSALEFPAAALWRRRRIPARQQALVAQVRPLPSFSLPSLSLDPSRLPRAEPVPTSSNKVLPSFTEFFF